jgi:hypothetical protein
VFSNVPNHAEHSFLIEEKGGNFILHRFALTSLFLKEKIPDLSFVNRHG